MSILVDPAIWRSRGRDSPTLSSGEDPRAVRWAHLVSDSSHDELHGFAQRLGIPPSAFHDDHYDVPAEVRVAAIELGALPVGSRELVTRLRAAGLRRPRPRAER